MTTATNNNIQQRQPRDSGARIGARYARLMASASSPSDGGGDIDIMIRY